ncbi:MAG: hypothetical protein JW734_05580 [Candidatus Omnitrophica bacterium]|nr:hypothetical protein [Candidatus Omnitrophota bacterium]
MPCLINVTFTIIKSKIQMMRLPFNIRWPIANEERNAKIPTPNTTNTTKQTPNLKSKKAFWPLWDLGFWIYLGFGSIGILDFLHHWSLIKRDANIT